MYVYDHVLGPLGQAQRVKERTKFSLIGAVYEIWGAVWCQICNLLSDFYGIIKNANFCAILRYVIELHA